MSGFNEQFGGEFHQQEQVPMEPAPQEEPQAPPQAPFDAYVPTTPQDVLPAQAVPQQASAAPPAQAGQRTHLTFGLIGAAAGFALAWMIATRK